MRLKSFIAILVVSIVLSACQQAELEENTPAPLEHLFLNADLNYEEYKIILQDVVQNVKNMDIDDPNLEKWVIRVIGDEKLMNKRDLSKEEALQSATERYEYITVWKDHARTTYNIVLTDEEVNTWIENNVVTSEDIPQQKAFAEALGLTIEQLIVEWDRDLYEQQVYWEKLIPLLEEKYETSDLQVLSEKYESEIEK
ncbi:hypothetical protein [Sutcliffiella sp. NC1]|uniref:hypothetical protein n=1 Tax=Sutcliffiella sp. NC1 TaxID=3004096 RepID=UPI0022DCF73A|nr:hypothetical protein [Sutcliffiella sp. NC1]WBL17229.1 hypothetical protein O1A01_11590 [Sutcliffiella sp. NC1]